MKSAAKWDPEVYHGGTARAIPWSAHPLPGYPPPRTPHSRVRTTAQCMQRRVHGQFARLLLVSTHRPSYPFIKSGFNNPQFLINPGLIILSFRQNGQNCPGLRLTFRQNVKTENLMTFLRINENLRLFSELMPVLTVYDPISQNC